MKFSERYGHKTVRDSMQLDSIDANLRNSLWNTISLFCWFENSTLTRDNEQSINSFFRLLWRDYLKRPSDELDYSWHENRLEVRSYFFKFDWFEVYDFIEFVADNLSFFSHNTADAQTRYRALFINKCNKHLENEVSAYRFVDGKISQITDGIEIGEIESALNGKVDPVRMHLQRALELLSDRSKPDYRNSIKESISAVESLVKRITEEDQGTLGLLLKKLNAEIELHPALNKAFGNLYGFTSDEGGIRHALMDKDKNDFFDAKFMLVACSAFINYVGGKSTK